MTRWLLLAALFALTSACAPGWALEPEAQVSEFEEPSSSPSRDTGVVSVREEAPNIEVPPLSRCERVCLRIAELSGAEAKSDERQAWIVACAERCQRDAAPGLLDCYERSTSAADLKFCMSP